MGLHEFCPRELKQQVKAGWMIEIRMRAKVTRLRGCSYTV